uniref:RanBD1 domain-containing protein n=1 Tax=Denticeps clupeoides TaxID=299321 RepID=A0AAY3ZYF9_9TELE
MLDLLNSCLHNKPAIAPPVFVFQKDKAQKRSADGSSAEDGEDSEKEDSDYCPPVKRERTSSTTQFPPSHSEEKPAGFRLKPPTLIHGQAPSAGVPSQKSKEQQRTVLRPAVLQAPASKVLSEPSKSLFTHRNTYIHTHTQTHGVKKDPLTESSFVFGENIKERAKLDEDGTTNDSKEALTQEPQTGGTNYFLQYIGSPSAQNATTNADRDAKFVFGQNMSDRVLSPPKGGENAVESSTEGPVTEPPSKETTPEKANNVMESLEESAAAYTKATAKKCILEKVEVRTGEESESNVLQIQCKLFVFDKPAQSWIERGRGLLRLNDMASTEDGTLRSRLVMRTQGSLRLILNTKLWPQMQVDKASEKSVRITAMDTEDQGVKVFLILASSKDIGQLSAALHHRILALKSRAEQEAEPTPPVPEPEVPQSNEEDSDEDEPANSTVCSGY